MYRNVITNELWSIMLWKFVPLHSYILPKSNLVNGKCKIWRHERILSTLRSLLGFMFPISDNHLMYLTAKRASQHLNVCSNIIQPLGASEMKFQGLKWNHRRKIQSHTQN